MYTKEQAQTVMQEYVDFIIKDILWNEEEESDIIIYENATEEFDFGWIFCYDVRDSKKNSPLVGNGPVIVEKETLDTYEMHTAYSYEDNIKMYLEDKMKLGKLEKDEDGFWDIVNLK
ncbi:hypothetical protein [Kordia jejudonensis]|uniref:hypothetical protein n=1 Tax=Kordia jejudonensis TaxID=1348245 RepID=UPI000629B55D|nr:hypothetical protein [Kordia jejudonensis]